MNTEYMYVYHSIIICSGIFIQKPIVISVTFLTTWLGLKQPKIGFINFFKYLLDKECTDCLCLELSC